MKISEYIKQLEALKATHGDLEVHTTSVSGHRMEANAPRVEYTRILQGRESRPTFWYSFDGEDRKGEKVVRV